MTDKPKWKRRGVIAALLLVMLLLVVGGLIRCRAHEATHEAFRNDYAAWLVAGMVLDYVTANHAWPRRWDDLRSSYEDCVNSSGKQLCSFEEVQRRIVVDWSVDTKSLIASAEAVLVIRTSDGGDPDIGWEVGPNRLIRQVMRHRAE
jgi:hypothetical protein